MSTIGLVQLLYAALAVVMAGLGLSLRLSDFAGLRRHGSSECRYTKVVDKDACRRLSRTVVSSAPCLPPWPTSSLIGSPLRRRRTPAMACTPDLRLNPLTGRSRARSGRPPASAFVAAGKSAVRST